MGERSCCCQWGDGGGTGTSALSQALPSPPRPRLLKNLLNWGREREEGEGEPLILESPSPVLSASLKKTKKNKKNRIRGHVHFSLKKIEFMYLLTFLILITCYGNILILRK